MPAMGVGMFQGNFSMVGPQKIKTELPRDPAILRLHLHLKEVKSPSWRDSYTPVFVATLSAIAKRGNYPSVHRQMSG